MQQMNPWIAAFAGGLVSSSILVLLLAVYVTTFLGDDDQTVLQSSLRRLSWNVRKQNHWRNQDDDWMMPRKLVVPVETTTTTTTTSTGFTYASQFGVVGDGITDDTLALQAAIDSVVTTTTTTTTTASATGGIVVLGPGIFHITSPLILPGGIHIQGQGYGSSPLAAKFDSGSSTIAYCGSDFAIRVMGSSASIRDLAVTVDKSRNCEELSAPAPAPAPAAGGILVEANATLIESFLMTNVFLYYFMDGTALTLRGVNNGGIAYATMSDVRIRHAKQGILVTAQAGSFVNSNQFYGGAISGSILDIAIKAEGPGSCNDNKFYGMVIEPPETRISHVYVTGPKTNVRMHNIRLEGTGMVAKKRPLVIITDDSYNNVMNGILGHTHVQADLLRNPNIDFVGLKTVGINPPPLNLFTNAAFLGFDGKDILPGWNIPGTNRNITVVTNEVLFPNHNILRVKYFKFGGSFQLSPTLLPQSPIHSQCTFGIYARSSVPGSIVATMRYQDGTMVSSTEHSGSGTWEFIAMSGLYDVTTKHARPIFFIQGDVDITGPTFAYGGNPASPGASLMSSSGAVMDGTWTLSMVTTGVTPPVSGSSHWILPRKDGNIFRMDMKGNPLRTIIRINDLTADRFPKGTVITLLFSEVGTVVKNNPYLKLLGNQDFIVTKPNSSLTLVANGDPTWTEISRNG
jgi:hypothetical protein